MQSMQTHVDKYATNWNSVEAKVQRKFHRAIGFVRRDREKIWHRLIHNLCIFGLGGGGGVCVFFSSPPMVVTLECPSVYELFHIFIISMFDFNGS